MGTNKIRVFRPAKLRIRVYNLINSHIGIFLFLKISMSEIPVLLVQTLSLQFPVPMSTFIIDLDQTLKRIEASLKFHGFLKK